MLSSISANLVFQAPVIESAFLVLLILALHSISKQQCGLELALV